jgi:hypothetical protein
MAIVRTEAFPGFEVKLVYLLRLNRYYYISATVLAAPVCDLPSTGFADSCIFFLLTQATLGVDFFVISTLREIQTVQ